MAITTAHTERSLTPLEVRLLAALKRLVNAHGGVGLEWTEARQAIRAAERAQ